MKRCGNCGLENADTSRFCKSCGRQLGEAIGVLPPAETCAGCYAPLERAWKFCKLCGHATDENTVVRRRVPERESPAPPRRDGLVTQVSNPPTTTLDPSGTTRHTSPGAVTPATPAADLSAKIAPVKDWRMASRLVKIGAILLSALLVFAAAAGGGIYYLGSTVTVQTNPVDATVLIDGREAGRTDANGALTIKRIRPGDHSLVIKRDGFVEWQQAFNISFAEMKKGINIKLEPVLWKLTVVTTPPGANVVVDDKPVGSTDSTSGKLVVPDLKPGDHTLEVRQGGYEGWKQTVKLSGDQSIQVTLNLIPLGDPDTPEGAVRSALYGWLIATRNRNLDEVIGHYADVVSYYYDRSAVPKSSIRDEYVKTFAKFEQLEIQYNNVTVVLDTAGTSATVTYDNTFDYQGPNGASLTGSAQMQLTFTKTGDAWLITGEKQLKRY